MTPVIFTFSAAKLLFRQPLRGFVSGAFCVDSHFDWYLHDIVIVWIILHGWKCVFSVPICKKNCMLVVFHLQVFAKVSIDKLFQLSILPHIASPDNKSRLPECLDANSLGIYLFKVDQWRSRHWKPCDLILGNFDFLKDVTWKVFLKQARTCLDVTWNCAKRVRCYMKVLRA